MNQQQAQIAELQAQVAKLTSDLNSLSQNFYKNNFSSSQSFNKDCSFNSRLKVPHYSAAPSVGEVGDLIEVDAKLYICTSTGPVTFTMVGTQS